jgi:[amino group carrier protein]-L-2-aminoadipate 6-kinase
VIVIKVGGSAGIDLEKLCDDFADLVKAGKQPVMIHGANVEATEISHKLGHPPRFVTSVSGYESRYTDEQTMNILLMVYSGKVNKRIVELLQKRGVNAVGISGCDGRLLECIRKDTLRIKEGTKRKVLRGDHSGKIENVNTGLLEILLSNGYSPVISPMSISHESDIVNVDGDRAAAMIAMALNADTLVMLSNTPGLLKEVEDENSLIERIPKNELGSFMEYAQGRMKKKVMGAGEALDGGVRQVVFADARIEKPITKAVEGAGTVIG